MVKTIARAPPPVAKAAERPVLKHPFGRRVWKALSGEARRLLPSWLFFYLSFSLLRLTQTAALAEFGGVTPPSRVLAGSLIVAKAIITVDALKMFRRLEARPILIASFFKTAVYMLVVFFFLYSDTLFEYRKLGLTEASLEFGRRLGTLRFWVIQVWLGVLLFVFSSVRSFARRLGRRRLRRYLLGTVERRPRRRS